jgi:co-chaperonin GroES (HSP10)
MSNLKPLRDLTLIRPLDQLPTSETILIAETTKKARPVKGEVLAIGPRVRQVVVGDIVRFHKHGPVPIKHEGEELYFVPEKELLTKE